MEFMGIEFLLSVRFPSQRFKPKGEEFHPIFNFKSVENNKMGKYFGKIKSEDLIIELE